MGIFGEVFDLFKISEEFLAPYIRKKLADNKKKKTGEERFGTFNAKEVAQTPSIIMGDRGRKEEGFKDLYKNRTGVDNSLQQLLDPQRAQNICIVSGRYSSGKSRAIQQLIYQDDGKTFKKIYKPEPGISVTQMREEIAKLSPTTLIVLDDINDFWERDSNGTFMPESFKGIFADINDRNLPCVVTIATGANGFQEFMETAREDNARGRQKGKSILTLEIKDILENDEVHMWCTFNFRSSLYSKVIGGYIPELSRHAEVNIGRILQENEAVIFLASYMTLKRFRNQKCAIFSMIDRMYEVIVSKDNIRDVQPSIPDLYDHSLDVLFDTGILMREEGRVYVDDTSLFRAFEEFCVGQRSANPTLRKYLSGTKEAEQNQIVRLIEMDGDDPAYYSRAIAKCTYPGHVAMVGKWLFRKFFEGEPLKVKDTYAADAEKMKEISFAACLLIGRDDAPIDLCQEMIGAGIAPSIIMVSELLRAANTHRSPQEKRQIMGYALDLKERHSIAADLYFLQMLEQCETGYSSERTQDVIDLYKDAQPETEEEYHILENSFKRYCKTLAQKADSEERMREYFRMLAAFPDLSFGPREVKALAHRISGKQGAAATPLLAQLADILMGTSLPLQIDGETRNTGIISILTLCHNANTTLDIYRKAVSLIERNLNPGDRDSYLFDIQAIAVMTYPLARKMPRLKSKNPLVGAINEEIIKRITSSLNDKLVGEGAAGKLFNTMLNNQPMDAANDSIDAVFDLFNNKEIFPADRDIDSLNSMFESAIRALPPISFDAASQEKRTRRCEDLLSLARRVDTWREKSGISADGRYYYFMFRIIDIIRHTDKQFDVSEIHDKMIDKSAVGKNELLICQEVRLTDSIGVVNTRADDCIEQMKKGVIQMNLINHLLRKFCTDFPLNQELGTKLDFLVKGSFNSVRHNVHDYQHYLGYFLTTRADSHSLDEVKEYLDFAWTALQHFGLPLREKNGDLLCTAIKSARFDFSETLSLMDFAMHYDRNCRTQDKSLFHFDTLAVLANKFRQQAARIESDEVLKEYLEDIQEIVYSLQEIGYSNPSETMTYFKTPIFKAAKKRIPEFNYIRIPFESDDDTIRHHALLQRIDSDGRGFFSTFELQQFIRQELFEINGHIFNDIRYGNEASPELIRDNIDFLMLALESAMANNPDLNVVQINKDQYIAKFENFNRLYKSQNNHFIYYTNFFDGYLSEGYISDDNKDRWIEMMHFYFD